MAGPDLQALEQAAQSGNPMARIELGNHLLGEHPPGSPESRRGLELLRAAAEGPGGAAAQWLLGGYFLQTPAEPDAHAEAARWLERAAAAGVPPAIDRLANLNLRGLGMPRDPARALELLARLADAGFQRAAWDMGYLLGQGEPDSDEPGAASAFARACALGYPPAYYSLGLRFALGAGVERDPAFARALLLRAHDGRFPDALAAADGLVSEEECGEESARWHGLLKENHVAARPMREQLTHSGITIDDSLKPGVRRLEAHFAALGHPGLVIDPAGRLGVKGGGNGTLKAAPGPWEWLSGRPRVGVSRHFATREECAHLMYKVSDSLARAEEYITDTVNGEVETVFFSGRGRPLGALTSDTVVRVLEQRIATMSECAVDTLEPCSIICYEPGEEYRPHVDYFNDEQLERNRSEIKDAGGQRVATFLLCLHAPEAGGETVYPETGLSVAYEPAMALLHYNVTADGRPDLLSVHTGRPVERGQKWLFRTTLREHSRFPATG